ncbi:Ras-related protein Rab-24 [Tritrichomonas foetus]|uniref:Ras-related protein Rab-24 n=1 Tax=Tritrichomonas foetus TaxID=1144522 RepID=A0A1J4KRH2_9EUKA|nr:Ras-related protein Rab-24 [Tritrichomonas foetus]|eukprot:OHT12412.1 Ras-related protein Rab-24 [Tritrichomonas foetus]
MESTASYTVRVIFVGNTNVGKTALNSRFLHDEFGDNAPTLTPTSSNITVRSTDGHDVLLQLWDTAGQERFQSLSQVFYRDANIALICVDASDPESFNSVQLWRSRALDHEPKCICVIVLTKIDLAMDRRSEIVKLSEEVQSANSIHDVFFTSSKTGEGVKECFGAIATLGVKELTKNIVDLNTTNGTNCVNIDASVNKKKKKECC